jgi:hypothetical protein
VPAEPEEAPRPLEVLAPVPPVPPVSPDPKGGARHRSEVLFGAVLIGVSFLVVGTALTTTRFTGPPFAEAGRNGTATIERCTERGPITLHGFGYYRRCTVTVDWNIDGPERLTIDQPGFFVTDPGDRIGDSFDIGQNGAAYSRPEVPERRWVTMIAWVVGLLGLLPLLALGGYLGQIIRA